MDSISSQRFASPSLGTDAINNAQNTGKDKTTQAKEALRGLELSKALDREVDALKASMSKAPSSASRINAERRSLIERELELSRIAEAVRRPRGQVSFDLEMEASKTTSPTTKSLTPSVIDADLASFWDNMPDDDAAMRYGRDAVQHNYVRDLNHLQDKVGQLERKISRMPDGPEKEAAASTLQRFADDQKQGLEQTRQMGLSNLSGTVPGFPRLEVPLPTSALGLFEEVRALTNELQNLSQSKR